MGTTVGHVLISYDVKTGHGQVKEAMIKSGYMSSWRETQSSPGYALPNTTLWHNNKSTNQAIQDIKSVCGSLGIILEKAVAVKASEFAGV